ncbi:MAG TPA: sigma-54 dependent transcriptional regulator [Vicinamibacterales bacterium]|nr:sigma-54 dependent transcriptional regulator [Vicinamibacterales bacterium]
MASVLVVDDLENFRISVGVALERGGYEVTQVANGQEALDCLARRRVDVVLTDVRMEHMDGYNLLRAVRSSEDPAEVIVMTGFGSIGDAVNAIKAGAYNYLAKPFRNEELLLAVQRAVEQRRLKEEVHRLRSAVGEAFTTDRLVGRSQPMEALSRIIRQVARTDAPVLILGESGVGKELVARTIHALSARSGGPFVAVNCGALPESIQETELFGYRKGAFTGASSDRKGLAEEADRGVLFLDEVGEMSLPLQVKLLRFLQDGEIRRVGDSRTMRANVRVISATNGDLDARVRTGAFRSDLYYRLNVVSIVVAPLRDRVDDIPLLAIHFLEQYARKYAKPIRGISEEAIARLKGYKWPGNVRELQNVIERAVTFVTGDLIEDVDLPREAPVESSEPSHSLAAQERARIFEAMQQSRWKRHQAARALGISRTTLWRKLKDYGIG